MGKSPFLKHGLPFLGLMLGGFAGLAYFIQGRIDVEDAQKREVDLRAPVQKQRAKSFDINKELERLKEAQLTAAQQYENKPVPRPKDW